MFIQQILTYYRLRRLGFKHREARRLAKIYTTVAWHNTFD